MTEKAPLEFYFDFVSPYSYLVSERIDALGAKHGRKVKWRPVLLGAICKALGTVPLMQQTDKSGYSERDFARSARFLGIPYAHPEKFPIASVAPARTYYWLHERDCARARDYAHRVFRAYFTEGRDISDAAVALDLAVAAGADRAQVEAGMQEQAVKDRLRKETDDAVALGMFGAPWIVVDNEAFWGADRLPQIEKWLETGGF